MSDQALLPELLARLAEHARRMDQVAETSIATVTADVVERDGKGTVLHTFHAVVEVGRSDGRRVPQVLHATRDGRDYRSEAQRRADIESRKARKLESPFVAPNSARYAFRVLSNGDVEQQWLRVALGPANERHATTDAIRGVALVDRDSGECVQLKGVPSKNPPFVHRAELTFDYLAARSGGRMLSLVTFLFEGGILMFRRSIEGTLRLDYTKR